MKSIIRLALLVSIFGIIYFISNKNEETKNVNKVEEAKPIVEETEYYYWRSGDCSEENFNKQREQEESQVNEVNNSILVVGQTNTYSNGDIKYTVEINSKEEITITKFELNEMVEGWSWIKRQCNYKSNSISVDWVGTEYKIKSDVLVVVANGQTKKYQII
jgi:hypothetical protein